MCDRSIYVRYVCDSVLHALLVALELVPVNIYVPFTYLIRNHFTHTAVLYSLFTDRYLLFLLIGHHINVFVLLRPLGFDLLI